MTTTVRLIGQDEWELLRDVRLAALADAPYAFGSTLEDWQDRPEGDWRARLARVRNFVALAEGGEPVGMVAWGRDEDLHDAELISMWVHPSARGTGTARALVDAVCADVAVAGEDHVRLWVVQDNPRAVAAYAKAGFVATGKVDPGDHNGPEIEMRKELP